VGSVFLRESEFDVDISVSDSIWEKDEMTGKNIA
jgi:hypothetical protein